MTTDAEHDHAHPRGEYGNPVMLDTETETTPAYVTPEPERASRGRRACTAALIAMLIAGVAGAVHISGAPRSVDIIGRLSAIAGVDDRFAPFDQREVQHLRDLARADTNSSTPDETILSYLEFRRTCRYLNRALHASEAARDDERSAVVHSIMDPELARADVSPTNDISIKDVYHRMTDEMVTGNLDYTHFWLNTECTGDGTLDGGYVDRVDR